MLPEPYTSIRLGKWQLGPDNQGFDHFSPSGVLGVGGAALPDAAAERSMYGNPQVADALTETAIEFMSAHRDQPFFVYLAHWDVHSPIRCTSRREEMYAAVLKRFETHGHPEPIPWQVSAMYGGMITAVDDRWVKSAQGACMYNACMRPTPLRLLRALAKVMYDAVTP